MSPEERTSLQRYARLAGFLYLFILAAYDLGDYLLVSPAIVPGDFATTAHNIQANETLYRLGLAGEFVASWLTILLAAGLYAITKPVNANLALAAFAFRIVEAAIGGICAVISFVALRVYAATGGAFDAHASAALVQLLSRAYSTCFTVTVIFFSLGSVIFFVLLYRSRFIPRLLSGFGVLASVLVTALGFVNLVVPKLAPMLAPGWMPILAAEVATGLWLLVRGVNTSSWEARA